MAPKGAALDSPAATVILGLTLKDCCLDLSLLTHLGRIDSTAKPFFSAFKAQIEMYLLGGPGLGHSKKEGN